ncbi:ABC transporter permease [Protaetiibacter larvae]|uniref:ABC transporter permease n=1 Tax=Protaetiibacter larvae TaxID=2592654 RepID=UPI001FE8341A|nr:ABC transporter permease [Protaetiibacter larvae]
MTSAIRTPAHPEGELNVVTPPRGLIAGTAFAIRGVWSRRELLGLLVRRELKSRYKNSSLGFVWSLLRPIAMLLIYYVAVGKFLGAERAIPEFAIFIFCGLTVWGLFSEIIGTTTTSIVGNAGLVKKIYLPRELFPLAAVGSSLFNFAVQFVVLIAATLILGSPPNLDALWAVPLGLATITVYAFAIGLLLSALNVYLRDIQHLVEIILLVLFWASPIVYSYQLVHDVLGGNWIEQVFLANPVTPVVLIFQQSLWSAGDGQLFPPDLYPRLGITLAISLLLTWIAQRIFARLEGNFAQEL